MTALVALVSDFGLADSYVGEMHAAIARRVPGARVIDVTHGIAPYDRASAALAAERAHAQLPRGAAIAVIVDPGVGTARRRIFARRDGVWLVGPDNGVLPLRAGRDDLWEVNALLCAPRDGVTTFDGREVFAPLAALLAAGLAPGLAGVSLRDPAPCAIPDDAGFAVEPGGRYACGVIVALDRYGNAVSNVRIPAAARGAEVVAPAAFVGPVRSAYGEVPAGAPVALVGSSGRLELSRRERASGLDVGDRVVVRCES